MPRVVSCNISNEFSSCNSSLSAQHVDIPPPHRRRGYPIPPAGIPPFRPPRCPSPLHHAPPPHSPLTAAVGVQGLGLRCSSPLHPPSPSPLQLPHPPALGPDAAVRHGVAFDPLPRCLPQRHGQGQVNAVHRVKGWRFDSIIKDSIIQGLECGGRRGEHDCDLSLPRNMQSTMRARVAAPARWWSPAALVGICLDGASLQWRRLNLKAKFESGLTQLSYKR